METHHSWYWDKALREVFPQLHESIGELRVLSCRSRGAGEEEAAAQELPDVSLAVLRQLEKADVPLARVLRDVVRPAAVAAAGAEDDPALRAGDGESCALHAARDEALAR